ncbi:hypothetical protein HaLaN_00666, partial [Haematococcus lacustris]
MMLLAEVDHQDYQPASTTAAKCSYRNQ